MLYPSVSDWWNARVQTIAIADYNRSVENLEADYKAELLEEARAYNTRLAKLWAPFSEYEKAGDYESLLNVSGNGVIGYITIDKLKLELPIYHGTSADVLNIAIGHLEGSSLPVGGTDTHTVLSGHRGLPSAKLFTDLDQLVEGDTFTLTVLDNVYTYEVEKILIVLPNEVEEIGIISGGDYCTLLTCTPYGVNTHRLLVRAHRIETIYQKTIKVAADAIQVDTTVAVPIIAAPLFITLFIYWGISGKIKKRRRQIKKGR